MRAIWAISVRLAYNLAFGLLLFLLLPWLVLRMWRRGNWRSQFGERFGWFDERRRASLAGGGAVWLHAVSVGEVQLVVRLAVMLAERLPGTQLVISTTTTTGMSELRRRLEGSMPGVICIYYPLDLWGCVRRSLGVVRPRAVILVEAEIWPNFLWRTQAMGVPVILVNARVSEKSRDRYRWLGCMFRGLFTGLDQVLCPTPGDAERLIELGCQRDRVDVVGNLKFDLAPGGAGSGIEVRRVLTGLGWCSGMTMLLGGSTHAGEERVLGQVWLELSKRFPELKLVVVPRHFERSAQAVADLEGLGLRVVRRSSLRGRTGETVGGSAWDVLVVDSTGELRAFYDHATVVFMGKSLKAQGGQNPIEPAAVGRAIVTGPHMENFRWIMAEFRRAEAVVEVVDAEELTGEVGRLLADAGLREAIGARARGVVEASSGAMRRTADQVVAWLERGTAAGAG